MTDTGEEDGVELREQVFEAIRDGSPGPSVNGATDAAMAVFERVQGAYETDVMRVLAAKNDGMAARDAEIKSAWQNAEDWHESATLKDTEIAGLREALRLTEAMREENLGVATAATHRAQRAEGVLRDLADPDPCYFDHNGFCQAHGYQPPCAHARARDHLAALAQPSEPATGDTTRPARQPGRAERMNPQQLRDRVARRIRDTVQLRYGPNAREIFARGGTVHLTSGEADTAADAALAVVEAEITRLTDKAVALTERNFELQQEAQRAQGALLRFAAEAHRRKWAHQGPPSGRSTPAFDELHRLGNDILDATRPRTAPGAPVTRQRDSEPAADLHQEIRAALDQDPVFMQSDVIEAVAPLLTRRDATIAGMRQLIEYYPPESDFVKSGMAALFLRTLNQPGDQRNDAQTQEG